MNGLRTAAALLTRVPVAREEMSDHDLARSIPWFPVVGGLVGIAVACVYAAAAWPLPPLVAATIAVGSGVALTGAFHEDGLADCADALGGWTRQEARRILKDPVHGTYGVLALVLSVTLRVGAVAALSPWEALAALPAAHALGRGAAVWALRVFPPAPGEGLGAGYAALGSRRQVVAGVTTALVIGAAAIGWGVTLAVGCGAGAVAVGLWARRRLGGISGDVLGAIEQVGEAVVLAGAAAILGAGLPMAPWIP